MSMVWFMPSSTLVMRIVTQCWETICAELGEDACKLRWLGQV